MRFEVILPAERAFEGDVGQIFYIMAGCIGGGTGHIDFFESSRNRDNANANSHTNR